MRLICPNCGAQYEVDGSRIPASGCDVQCSNCGTTWFHETTARVARRDVQAPEITRAAPEVGRTTQGADLDLLREEAEEEAHKRATESAGLEAQTEMGLDDTAVQSRAIAARRVRKAAAVSRERPDAKPAQTSEPIAPPVTDTKTRPTSRRDLLPDIEEINTTLKSQPSIIERLEASADPEKKKRRFSGAGRIGFSLMLLAAALGFAVYLLAPTIAEAVPEAEPYLERYVAWVDKMRVILDGIVGRVADRLSTLAEKLSGIANSSGVEGSESLE